MTGSFSILAVETLIYSSVYMLKEEPIKSVHAGFATPAREE